MTDEGYKCPKCGENNLKVTSCRVHGDKMFLAWDGFTPEGSTEDEIVECTDCGYEDDIGKFMPPMKLHGQTAEEWADELFDTQCCDACGHDKELHDIIPLEGNWFARCQVDEKPSDWSDKQKIAFIKIQDLLSDIGLTNEEVAEMFSRFDRKERIHSLFQFQTGFWARKLHLCDKCREPMEVIDIHGLRKYRCSRCD